jgi:F-type H+-transporting ATPase subunit epsilon
MGEITVLPRHIPLVATVEAGELRAIDADGKETLMAVSGGFVNVGEGSRVVILADSAERAEELDLAAIEAAKKRAEAIMEEQFDDEERYADAVAGLARELARWKVARKWREQKGLGTTTRIEPEREKESES